MPGRRRTPLPADCGEPTPSARPTRLPPPSAFAAAPSRAPAPRPTRRPECPPRQAPPLYLAAPRICRIGASRTGKPGTFACPPPPIIPAALPSFPHPPPSFPSPPPSFPRKPQPAGLTRVGEPRAANPSRSPLNRAPPHLPSPPAGRGEREAPGRPALRADPGGGGRRAGLQRRVPPHPRIKSGAGSPACP